MSRSNRIKVRKQKKGRIPPYLFYLFMSLGLVVASLLLYQIYTLFRRPITPQKNISSHVDLSGVGDN